MRPSTDIARATIDHSFTSLQLWMDSSRKVWLTPSRALSLRSRPHSKREKNYKTTLGRGHPACIAGPPSRSRDLSKLYARKLVELFLKTISPKYSFAIFRISFLKTKSKKTTMRDPSLTPALHWSNHLLHSTDIAHATVN